MKQPGICLLVIVLLTFGVGAHGQPPPKAVLLDEYGMLPCDDNLGRIDAFHAELAKNSNSTGLVVIASAPDRKHVSVFRQYMMELNAKFRGADKLPIKYLRANSESDFRVQMWRIPAGADEPEIQNPDMSYTLPNDLEPFILASEYVWDDPICPGVNELSVFSKFLKGNPSSRGNLVIRDRTVERARRKAARILREFEKGYDIPRSRLRVFPRKSAIPANNLEPIVEYWYLP